MIGSGVCSSTVKDLLLLVVHRLTLVIGIDIHLAGVYRKSSVAVTRRAAESNRNARFS